MEKYKKTLTALAFALIAFIFNQISHNYPEFVLHYYSHSINKVTIQIISRIFGIFPFSVFEILIYISFLTFVSYFIFTIFKCFKYKKSLIFIITRFCINLITIAAIFYGAFIFLWGLNYNRPPLASELNLEVINRSTEELVALGSLLTEKANISRDSVLENEKNLFTTNQSPHEIFSRASAGFEAIAFEYPFLSGNYGPVKGILGSALMNYTFITGIYSPFTGEPNVNIETPESTLIFTTLHEMAHQRGIAPENDANFVAFLACIYHPDIDFQYSGYFNALNYTRSAIRRLNPSLIQTLNESLNQGVINDINYQVDFWNQFQGPIESTFEQINETYLRANGVTEGTQSYGLVVDLLLAFYQDEIIEYMKK